MSIGDKLRQLIMVRHIVEANGSEKVLARVDYDIDMLIHKLHWNGD